MIHGKTYRMRFWEDDQCYRYCKFKNSMLNMEINLMQRVCVEQIYFTSHNQLITMLHSGNYVKTCPVYFFLSVQLHFIWQVVVKTVYSRSHANELWLVLILGNPMSLTHTLKYYKHSEILFVFPMCIDLLWRILFCQQLLVN